MAIGHGRALKYAIDLLESRLDGVRLDQFISRAFEGTDARGVLCKFCRDEGVCSHSFGVCPECEKSDGYINVGRGHWFFCKAHKVKWCVGSNLFSGWREETEEEQRRAYDEIGMGYFTEIKPRDVCTQHKCRE